MEKDRINILYDENGKAIRVQMDFDIYEWLVDHMPQLEQTFAVAK